MAECGGHEELHVLQRHMHTPFQQCAGFGAQYEILCGAQAGSPTDPVLHEVRRVGLSRSAGRCQSDGVAHQVFRDGHTPHHLVEPAHVVPAEDRLDRLGA